MERRFTTAEKGKGVVSVSQDTNVRRIRAPPLDTTDLVRENALTLIGRLTNPSEQRIGSLIPSLPRKWDIQGRVIGSDIGNNCFQFRFETERDLQRVLDNRPYHFNYWMIILQRWEPIISEAFPSIIPFWVRIKGLPLHFWQEGMVRSIGRELGAYDTHEITKTSAKVRVMVNALKPLITETIIEFATGEECKINLEYERLENHCSHCGLLSHLPSHCPTTPDEKVDKERGKRDDEHNIQYSLTQTQSEGQQSREVSEARPFQQRVDRHGRSYGDRVSTKQTRVPPPVTRRSSDPPAEARGRDRTMRNDTYQNTSPQYVHNRRHHPYESSHRRTPFPPKEMKEWRAKGHVPEQTNRTAHIDNNLPQLNSTPARIMETPTEEERGVQIPTQEEVMDQLHEVTLQYLSCADPTEAAARQRRVIASDSRGLTEETAARIIRTAQLATSQPINRRRDVTTSEIPTLRDQETPRRSRTPPPVSQVHPPAANQILYIDSGGVGNSHTSPQLKENTRREGMTEPQKRKRGRPAKLKSLVVSPNVLTGASSKKVLMSQLRRSPARTGASPNQSQSQNQARQRQGSTSRVQSTTGLNPPINLIPAMARKKGDFRPSPHPAP